MKQSYLSAFLLSVLALAALGDECRVTNVHDGEFEESLGVYGSEVDDDSEDVSWTIEKGKVTYVSVGGNSWWAKKEKITIETKGDYKVITVDGKEDGYSIQIISYPSHRGIVNYRQPGEKEWLQLATFDCSSTQVVQKANLDDKNVVLVTRDEQKKLSKEAQARLNAVDLPAELGDGKYVLKSQKLYKVKNENGSTAGYLYWGRLLFTEDQTYVTALVRFDRNVLRLGEAEFND